MESLPNMTLTVNQDPGIENLGAKSEAFGGQAFLGYLQQSFYSLLHLNFTVRVS